MDFLKDLTKFMISAGKEPIVGVCLIVSMCINAFALYVNLQVIKALVKALKNHRIN